MSMNTETCHVTRFERPYVEILDSPRGKGKFSTWARNETSEESNETSEESFRAYVENQK